MHEKFSGYVLAGGKSSRMKTDKAFLEIGDENFIERAVKVLKFVCKNRISVVLNSEQTISSRKFPVGVGQILDVYQNRGALGGIHAALQNCQTEWAVILAVDLPFVTTEVINFLANAAHDFTREIAAVIPQQPDGKWQPLCGIYRAALCVSALERIFQRNENLSVRGFLEKMPIKIIDSTKFFDDAELQFSNVNTPDDYRKLFFNW